MATKPAPKHVPAKRGRGRPPKFAPETQAEALRLAAETTPEDAAETMARRGVKVSSRQIRHWQEGKFVAGYKPAAAPPAATTAPKDTDDERSTAQAPPVPAELHGPERRLWIIRSRIDATRTALARADVEPGGLGRISQLTSQLTDLLKQESIVERDATPDDPAAEERRWERAAAVAVGKVKAGVNAARERMGALLGRPFPYAA